MYMITYTYVCSLIHTEFLLVNAKVKGQIMDSRLGVHINGHLDSSLDGHCIRSWQFLL